jgi:hypothetical protein
MQPCPRHLARPPISAVLAVLALAVAACGTGSTAAPALTDPVAILQAGAASVGEMKTVHVRGVIEGEVSLGLGGLGGGAAGGAPLPLKGTTLDADVDVANSALAAELVAPTLLNMRINLIVVDGSSYLRAPILTGDSWVRQPAEGGIGGDPGAALQGLSAFLAQPGLQPVKLPDVRCAGTDCYSVQFTVTAQDLADALGSLGSSIPGLSGAVGDVTVTVGVRKDNLDLATLSLEVPAGGTTPLTISLELTKVDEPVTIEAPPADQVKDAPGGPAPSPGATAPTTG